MSATFAFAAFLQRSPETATAEDVRRFQLHHRGHGVRGPGSGVRHQRNSISAALPVRRNARPPDLSRKLVLAPRPRKLPDVLSIEEVARLLEAAPRIKYRAVWGSRTAPDCGCPRSHTSTPTTSTANPH